MPWRFRGVEVSNAMKVGFPRMRLAGETRQGRNDTLHVQKRCARPLEPLRQLRTALPMGIRRAGPCVRRAGFEPAALCWKLFRLERCAEFPFSFQSLFVLVGGSLWGGWGSNRRPEGHESVRPRVDEDRP